MDPVALFLDPLQYRFVARGLAMALLLGVGCGLVGTLLVVRRVVLMADSFGHALLPGVAGAFLLLGPGLVGLFSGAVAAGLACVLLAALVARSTRLGEDAAFGSLFTCCFALGVALMSRVAAPVDLLHYLFGNILGITAQDLTLVAVVVSLTVLALCLCYRPIVLEVLDPLFHRSSGGWSRTTHAGILVLTVLNLVAALQAVGMVLALGLVILPATTAQLWCDRIGSQLTAAAAIGAGGAAAGLYASYHLNLPSGACMVGALGVLFLGSLALAPHGLRASRGGLAGG